MCDFNSESGQRDATSTKKATVEAWFDVWERPPVCIHWSRTSSPEFEQFRVGVERSSPRARDILSGENPAEDIRMEKQTPIFREFTDEYLRRCDPHWKPSGRKTVRIYLKARILPAFGKMPIDRIGPEDVAAWFDTASRRQPSSPAP